ncbi:MAG: LysR family transcriptional regulator [Burkholderiales bacterium]|nr:LysR family transcriptional regulator [Burkholderiales bacterium]
MSARTDPPLRRSPHPAARPPAHLPLDLNLSDVALLLRTVELGSLSAAARERNVPVSQVTRALARLEKTCRARLLHRSTHGLSLTDEGGAFLPQARRMLEAAEEFQGEIGGRLAGPRGWVRISVSAVLAQAVIAPGLPSLHERHPGVHLDISADDRLADMARDSIDIAIRTGTPASDNLVARPIGQLRRSLYAAPAYLARHGTPGSPEEVGRHRLLANSVSPSLNLWGYDGGQTLQVQGHTRTDNTAVIVALALSGAGIARIIDLVATPLVKTGALVPVLPGRFSTAPVPMYAVMLQERHRLPKIRACVDYWAQWMSEQAPPR